MKQMTVSDKKEMGRPITDGKGKMWFRDRVFSLLMLLSRTKVKYKVKCLNKLQLQKDKPVIFTANHSAFADGPIALRVTGRQSYAFIGVQRLAFEDRIFFSALGAIWVDRTDKEDMRSAKEALTAYLQAGRSVLWFSEGTWNLTENQMMLPMKWGIIDVARETGAQILPFALDYDRESMVCRVKFGEPFHPTEDLKREINNLRDRIATLRWEIWEERGIFCRKDLDMEACRRELLQPVLEYPPIEWDKEEQAIFKPYASPEEIFAFRKRLNPCRENGFLLRG